MKINLQKISRQLLVIGLSAFGIVLSAQAQVLPKIQFLPPAKIAFSNVVFKEKAFQVQITPTNFSSHSGLNYVSGTGQIKLSGTLTTVNGACARIKITIKRLIISPISSTILKEQTFEMCGTQQINMTDNLNASEDDARFPITVENIDPWNHTTVTGTLSFRSPTAELVLTGQPAVLFDLAQGAEANRAFTLIPNTPGKLRVKVSYLGNTQVRVTLKKPNGSNAAAPTQGASGQEFLYDIAAADITNGNVWTVNVLNLQNTLADDVNVSVIYSVDQ